MRKVKVLSVTETEKITDNVKKKNVGRPRTSNYNKLGEVTKRQNREMLRHRQKYGKTEQYQAMQDYLKTQKSKGLSKYDRKKQMWVIVTPRTKEGKESVKDVQYIFNQNFASITSLENAKKIIANKYGTTIEKIKADTTKRKDNIMSQAFDLWVNIQRYGFDVAIGEIGSSPK